jgi:LysM repeat protein
MFTDSFHRSLTNTTVWRTLLNLCLFTLVLNCLVPTCANGAPRRYTAEEDSSTALREMRDSIDTIRHEVDNHETEIRMFDERVNNQEATISSLRQQLQDANQANKELLKGSSNSLEIKITSLEATNKSLMSDMAQFKTHANESADVLEQYKKKITELEKMLRELEIILAKQNQNITNIQSAMASMMDALQVKEVPASKAIAQADGSKIYKIKPGDSLEKIARANSTTVKAIKDANNLTTDRIVVGQTLQLP